MKLFITGISTDVGKTIASAIIVEALEADYWKPVQAGDVDSSDSHKVKSFISNKKTIIHPNSYLLNTPASPHLAAAIDGFSIDLKQIKEPITQNHLVIEGAGGVFVPLNDTDCIIDLIQPDYKVIVVSRHYLGSINHTLLSLESLKVRKLKVKGIIFNDKPNLETENYILNYSGVKCLGRIDEHQQITREVVLSYKNKFNF